MSFVTGTIPLGFLLRRCSLDPESWTKQKIGKNEPRFYFGSGIGLGTSPPWESTYHLTRRELQVAEEEDEEEALIFKTPGVLFDFLLFNL